MGDVQDRGTGVRVPSGADRERLRTRVSRFDPDPLGRHRDRAGVAVAGGADVRGNVRGILKRHLQTDGVGRAGALLQLHLACSPGQIGAVVVDDLDRDHQAMMYVLPVPGSPVGTAAAAVVPDPVPGAGRRLALAVIHRGKPDRLGIHPVRVQHGLGRKHDRVVDREQTVVDFGVVAAVRSDVVVFRRDDQIRGRRLVDRDGVGDRCALGDLHAPGPHWVKPRSRHVAGTAQRDRPQCHRDLLVVGPLRVDIVPLV